MHDWPCSTSWLSNLYSKVAKYVTTCVHKYLLDNSMYFLATFNYTACAFQGIALPVDGITGYCMIIGKFSRYKIKVFGICFDE